MKFNNDMKVFGDITFRGNCPSESAEQMAFFSWLRTNYPKYGDIAIHPKNEGVRSYNQASLDIAEGMVSGASDIIIPCSPAFACELKRANHTKSKWQPNQQEYLQQVSEHGGFACVALGHKAAIEAFKEYLKWIA